MLRNTEGSLTKIKRIMKQTNLGGDEMKVIWRQIGFGAVLGITFLAVVYLGGLIAQLMSNF